MFHLKTRDIARRSWTVAKSKYLEPRLNYRAQVRTYTQTMSIKMHAVLRSEVLTSEKSSSCVAEKFTNTSRVAANVTYVTSEQHITICISVNIFVSFHCIISRPSESDRIRKARPSCRPIPVFGVRTVKTAQIGNSIHTRFSRSWLPSPLSPSSALTWEWDSVSYLSVYGESVTRYATCFRFSPYAESLFFQWYTRQLLLYNAKRFAGLQLEEKMPHLFSETLSTYTPPAPVP